MKNFLAAAAGLLLAAGAASAQDDLDARLEELGAKLSREGASGRLAELCASLFGREAIKERIAAVVDHRAGRLDRDPYGPYQERLFARDATGALRARPERSAELERLAADVAGAHRRMDAFNRRAFALVGRIAGDGPLERRARAWWSDSPFRIAFFASRAGELREQEAPEILHDLVGRMLERRDAGGLRVGEAFRDELREGLAAVEHRLEEIRSLDGAYLRNLAGLEEDARRILVTDAAAVHLLGRVLRERDEGAEEPIAELGEAEGSGATLAFHAPLSARLGELREAERLLGELKPWFEATAAALRGGGEIEGALAEALGNARVRALVAERILATRREQRRSADRVLAEVLEDGFEKRDGTLAVKKGRYPGEDGQDSADSLDAEHRGVVDGFRAERRPFDLIAEHCADEAAARTFASLAGTLVLREHLERTVRELRGTLEARGFESFVELYLEKRGETYQVRPERASRIAGLIERASELKREQDP